MERRAREPRADWVEQLQALGIPEPTYRSEQGTTEQDWSEEAVYVLSEEEANTLSDAAERIRGLVLEGVATALEDDHTLERMAIPPQTQTLLRESWERGERNFVSRYDWSFSPDGLPKLLDINAETCFGMLLASRGQAQFRATEYPDLSQWNSFESAFQGAFRHFPGLKQLGGLKRRTVYFANGDEDGAHSYETEFARACAEGGGHKTAHVSMDDIAFDTESRYFVDGEDRSIEALFLYQSWAMTIDSPIAEYFFEAEGVNTVMMEPLWRLLVGNKAFLAWLWEQNEGHDLLLPTFVDFDARADQLGDTYAQKPFYGFDAANVRLLRDGQVLAENPDEEGDTESGTIYQALCELPVVDGKHVLVSTWEVAASTPALSITEGGPITDYFAPMVPHVIDVPA